MTFVGTHIMARCGAGSTLPAHALPAQIDCVGPCADQLLHAVPMLLRNDAYTAIYFYRYC